jgi:type I restriction enzyme S subunit
MKNGRIQPDPMITISEVKAQELQHHSLEIGDIVLARRGELGRCAVVTEGQNGWLCGTGSLCVRLRPKLFNPLYLVQLIGSSGVRDFLKLSSIGATMDNLNSSMVARLRLPRPPMEEQCMIMKWIAHRASAVESAILKANNEIKYIREYRSRLIADVVTGKLDVRGAAAQLPEELEKLEPAEGEEILPENAVDQEDMGPDAEEGES